MDFPLSTGQVAKLLGVAEHRITSQVRLGKIDVPIVCGRRAWAPAEVLKVAKLVGKDSLEIRNMEFAMDILTVEQAARFLEMSHDEVQQIAQRKEVPYLTNISGAMKFQRSELAKWKDQRAKQKT